MSGLSFDYGSEVGDMDVYVVTERLALTEPDDDGNQLAVPEEDSRARWFFAAEGAQISVADAERYGLLNGKTKTAAAKPEPKSEDKPKVAPGPLAGLNAKDAAKKVAALSAKQLAKIPETEVRKGVVSAIERRKAALAS